MWNTNNDTVTCVWFHSSTFHLFFPLFFPLPSHFSSSILALLSSLLLLHTCIEEAKWLTAHHFSSQFTLFFLHLCLFFVFCSVHYFSLCRLSRMSTSQSETHSTSGISCESVGFPTCKLDKFAEDPHNIFLKRWQKWTPNPNITYHKVTHSTLCRPW